MLVCPEALETLTEGIRSGSVQDEGTCGQVDGDVGHQTHYRGL